MESFEPKKLLILRILDILTEYSDSEHKLRQADIIRLLKIRYDIECERKAVARNIDFLQRAGYDIVVDGGGCYLAERKYTAGELRLLIDSVLSNRHVSKKYTRELIAKLAAEGGRSFTAYTSHVINLDDWQKEESRDFFYNIELLVEAIDKGVQVEYTYNYYGADKKLHQRDGKRNTVTPYQLLLKNSAYYLLGGYDKYDNATFLRVDRMSDIVLTDIPALPITRLRGYEDGLNLGRLSCRLPYMYDDAPVTVELRTTNGAANILDMLFDWFGRAIGVREEEDGEYRITLVSSPAAMRFWVLQFGRYVKVLSPQSLVDTIKQDIEEMKKLYE